MNPSTHLENDEFGYSCYAMVIPAPPILTEPLLEIERAAGQERAKIPAHITVKGTVYGMTSLDGLIETIRDVTSRHTPFSLSTDEMEVHVWGTSVVLGFPVNPEIQALHDELVATVTPISKPAYQDDPYRVHMSIVNEVSPEGAELAKQRIGEIDFSDGLQVDVIDLMGRDGVAWGGTWKRLERFRLGG